MTTRAAIYARKSTDSDAGVDRQIEIARDFGTELGRTVDDGDVFRDNDVSGAIFNRPGLNALLNAVERKDRRWNVLILMNVDRLSRGSIADSLFLQQRILEAGVEIWEYQTKRRIERATATDELKGAIDAHTARSYRDDIAAKVRPAMRKKAEQGHQTGTVALGYESVVVGDHKELRKRPDHAAIVLQIFEWSAKGWGIKRIADKLNAEYPSLRRRGWSGAGVRETLNNQLYNGVIVFGKSRQVTTREGKHKVAVPEKDWVRVEREDLRIVPAPLWKAVHRRKAELFKKYERTAQGRLQGRPETTLDAKHLLAGFCVCSECGGRMVVWAKSTKKTNYRYLVCNRHRAGTCANKRSVPLEPLTDAIVAHFTEGVLTAQAIAQVTQDLAADADGSPERVAARREALKAELGQMDKRITQAVEALIAAPSSPALAEALKGAEAQKTTLQARLTQLDEAQATVAAWTEAGHQERVQQLLGDWQGALRGAPEVGRQILKKLLVGHIIVRSWTDSETGKVAHSYEAQGTYGKALSGTVANWGLFAPEDERGTGGQDDLRAELKALVEALPMPVGPAGPTS
jgi:site-specific DNA recombinase